MVTLKTVHFVTTRTAPKGYTIQQKKELVVRVIDFSIIIRHLYKMGSDEVLRRYVPEFERSSILADAHGGAVGGNYVGRVIAHKILRVGLWWRTLHKDSKAYCRASNMCQRTSRPSRSDELPLNPQMMLQPFKKWAIDFVGPIQPQGKKTGAQYIITVTEYLTRWAEAQPVKDSTGATTVKFLFEYVLTRFGLRLHANIYLFSFQRCGYIKILNRRSLDLTVTLSFRGINLSGSLYSSSTVML